MDTASIIESIKRGNVPVELEVKSDFLEVITIAAAALPAVTAVLIAAARRDNFSGDVNGWAEWASERYQFCGSQLSHLKKIGDMLLNMIEDDQDAYDVLFPLAQDKQLSISRLSRYDVPRFLKAHDVVKMDRDQVRAAVNACLGLVDDSPGKQPEQLQLPGFEAALDSLIMGGKNAAEAMKNLVKTPEKAAGAFRVGISMLSASVKYYTEAPEPDSAKIAAIAGTLEDAARQLREYNETIAGQATAIAKGA